MACTEYLVADIAFVSVREGVLEVIGHVGDRMGWTVDGIEISGGS